jgi:putative FmdB family regulatory protein
LTLPDRAIYFLSPFPNPFPMPTYEYACQKCGHTFEHLQSMSAAPLTTCPKDQCPQKRWGKGKVKRAIGAGAGLLFKGSGFYITDYRSAGYQAAQKKDSGGGETKPAGDSKPAAESKPAAGAKPAPKAEKAPAKKSPPAKG